MSYDGRNLSKYLGSQTSALGLLLFWFGAGGLFVSAIIWAWLTGANSQDVPPKVYLAIPIWGAVAAPLGLFLRKGNRPAFCVAFALFWLAIALGFSVSVRLGIA